MYKVLPKKLWQPPRAIIKLLLIMKLTTLILITAILQVSATGFAQKISLSEKNTPLIKVLEQIRTQSGYDFMFSSSSMEGAKKVTINVKNQELKDVLKLIFEDQPLEYEINANTVVVSKKARSFLEKVVGAIVNIDVRGTVVDENGNPLEGASVKVKAINKVTKTDAIGEFYLQGVGEGAVLQISYVGYKTQEIKAVLNIGTIKMELEDSELEEVMVSTGYWTTTKKRSTGNISKVTAKDIERQPITSPLMAIQGRMPGVDITPLTGAPGSAPAIQIRGQNSLRFDGGYPLYVIDGVPIDSKPVLGLDFIGIDPLLGLSTANIESIEVLKDAAATSIYGSRGANGVVLIATKSGSKQDRLAVNVNFYTGAGKMPRKVELLNAKQYLEMRNEALSNDGAQPMFFDVDLNGVWDSTRETDWQDVLLGGSSSTNSASINISGGNGYSSYNIGTEYYKETSFISSDFGFKRSNVSLGATHSSRDGKFTSSIKNNFGFTSSELFTTSGFINSALALPPVAPALYNADGSLNWAITELFPGYFTNSWQNPIADMRKTQSSRSTQIISNIILSYEVLPKFSIKLNGGYSLNKIDENRKFPISSQSPTMSSPTASSTFSYASRSTWIVEPQAMYSDNFNDHHIDAIIGGSYQQNNSNALQLGGFRYTSDVLLRSILAAPNKQILADDNLEYKYAAVFGRLGYRFKERYLIDLTARRDGSSRFGPNKKYGNFGAIGAAWNFSEEEVVQKNFKWLNYGKLRASYGITGNDQVGDFLYKETYTISPYLYQSYIGYYPASLLNANLAWEKTRKAELGLEMGILNDKLMIEVSHYMHRSSNQLVGRPTPLTTGFQTIRANLNAVVQNTGWEFSAGVQVVKSKEINWSLNGNLTIPKNKLISYPGLENTFEKDLYKVGEPVSIRKRYVWQGIDPQTGEHKIADTDGNGLLNFEDRVFTNPSGRDLFGGINNEISFKAFRLSFLFQYSKFMQTQSIVVTPPGASPNNQPVEVLNRWRKPGDITDFGKFTSTNVDLYNNFVFQSDFNDRNISFFRLKTLSFSYDLLQSVIKGTKLNQAQIFLQGQNLLVISGKYAGFDPETIYVLPPMKIITCGVQVQF